MNVCKIYKYNPATVAFVLNKVERVLSCNYNKKINEMGQINLVLDYESVAEVEDFIEVFLAEKRLATGYIAEINKSKTSVTVVALTEEYKLAKCIMPTEYTQNVTGLTLETIAKMISRRYWQVRWMDREDLRNTSKITSINFGAAVKDTIATQLTRKAGWETFAYELLNYYQEGGFYEDLAPSPYKKAYDRVAILGIHRNTMTQASTAVVDYSAASTVNIGDLVASDFERVYFYLRDDGGVVSQFLKDVVSGQHNVVLTTDNVIVGVDVIGSEGCKLKIFLDSSAADYAKWESILIRSNYPTTITGATAEGLYFIRKGTQNLNTSILPPGSVEGELKTTSGFFKDQIIERIRWEEPVIESYREYYSDIFRRTFFEGVLTLGAVTTSFSTSFKNPNEFTTRAGIFTEPFHPVVGGEYAAADLTFRFSMLHNTIVNNVQLKEDAILVTENIINQDYVKALEFIMYQKHLANSVVAAALQNLRPTQFEMNGNTNYDVLRDICDESQARFKVEDDVLTISEKGTGTPTSFILHDEINCTIDTVQISDEQLFNFQYFEGQGDGVLNKPFVEILTASKAKKTRKSLPIVKTEQKTKAELKTFATLYNSALNTTTKLINIETTYNQIGQILVKEGDIVKAIHNGVTYEGLEVEELTYNLTEEDAEITISAGNSNKKLT